MLSVILEKLVQNWSSPLQKIYIDISPSCEQIELIWIINRKRMMKAMTDIHFVLLTVFVKNKSGQLLPIIEIWIFIPHLCDTDIEAIISFILLLVMLCNDWNLHESLLPYIHVQASQDLLHLHLQQVQLGRYFERGVPVATSIAIEHTVMLINLYESCKVLLQQQKGLRYCKKNI